MRGGLESSGISLPVGFHDMTLTTLGERVGLTLANLSIQKTNKARAIRFSPLESLCRKLECRPGDLITFLDED